MKPNWIREWRALCVAVGLLSRVPIPASTASDSEIRARSLHWYPAAGLVVGLPLAALTALSPASPLLTATLVLGCWVAITGAIHLDGLADCADAWVGGMGDRQRTLTIMKDPASGPVAVVTLVLLLLLKLAALVTLVAQPLAIGWWLAPIVARAITAVAFTTTPYARADGMGQDLTQGSREAVAAATGLTLLAAMIVLPGLLWWIWLATATLVFLAWRRAMLNRLGGFTGDGAGALVEVQETSLLLATALMCSSLSSAGSAL